jgi:hypothetical protein
MTGGLKWLLGCAGLIVVVVVVAVVWFGGAISEAREAVGPVQAEAVAYGSGRMPGDCVDAALNRRLERSESGVTEVALDRVYLDACLRASTPDPEFCGGVPARGEFRATADWAIAECGRRGQTDPACSRLIVGVQGYCSGPA